MLTLNTADRSHVARILSLVNLAPDIVTLTKVLYKLPNSWQEQSKLGDIA